MLRWLQFGSGQFSHTFSLGNRNISFGKKYYYIYYNADIQPYFSLVYIFVNAILSLEPILHCQSKI